MEGNGKSGIVPTDEVVIDDLVVLVASAERGGSVLSGDSRSSLFSHEEGLVCCGELSWAIGCCRAGKLGV